MFRLAYLIIFILLSEIEEQRLTVVGRIYSGMHVVKRIGLVETDKNDRPVDDVKIVKAYVKEEWFFVTFNDPFISFVNYFSSFYQR